MTKQEFSILGMAIKTYYPRDNLLPSEKSLELWYDMLSDIDYKTATIALKAYVAANKFPPGISDIREYAAKITDPEELTEMEAWSMVLKAIRNSGYNAVSEYEKLPNLVKKAVGKPSQLFAWATDENFRESVASSNFIKAYRAIVARQREKAKMPESVRAAIDKCTSKMIGANVSKDAVLINGKKGTRK